MGDPHFSQALKRFHGGDHHLHHNTPYRGRGRSCPRTQPISAQGHGEGETQNVSLSRVRLFATLWTVVYQAPLCTEFSRQLQSELPFLSPGDLPDPGIKLRSPAPQPTSWSFLTPSAGGTWHSTHRPQFGLASFQFYRNHTAAPERTVKVTHWSEFTFLVVPPRP